MVIKCFGIARDIFKSDEIVVDHSSINTVADLRSFLNTMNAQLSSVKSYLIAINQEYADDAQEITNTDEIAIIPPVSGG